jgi:cytochrome P450
MYEPTTRALCAELVDTIVERGAGDAAVDYAQQIPVRVIARVLGVPDDMSDAFTGWVRDVLEFANVPERRAAGRNAIVGYLASVMDERRERPGDDLISFLLHADGEDGPVADAHVLGTAALTLVAGVDTTWSAIGSSLWHLATHDDDRRRLVEEPDLLPIAIEELLRAYSPVTMGRIVAEDVEIGGCPMKAGDRVLMSFPAANRDERAFPDADKVIIDRARNRHVAFGVGIHRCAGSNLARMELKVALEEWLTRIPDFEIAPGAEITWAGGQVRGPRSIPVVVG